jgi:hypothetical protein
MTKFLFSLIVLGLIANIFTHIPAKASSECYLGGIESRLSSIESSLSYIKSSMR